MVNNIAVAKQCIEDGEDPNIKDRNGASAIEVAASWSSELILEYLLDLNVDIEHPAKLIHCINMGLSTTKHGRYKSGNPLKRILERFPTTDLNKSFNEYHRYNIIGSAAINDYTEGVRILLEHGASPNVTNPPQCNPLIFSVSNSNPEIVQQLLVYGADPNATMRTNHPILSCITNISYYAFKKPLHLTNLFGMRPLIADAAPETNLECFILLVTHGSRYTPDNNIIEYMERHEDLFKHAHYKLFKTTESQEHVAKLFVTIKQRWWVRKIILSGWYRRSMMRLYAPYTGNGYHSTMNDIGNLLQNM